MRVLVSVLVPIFGVERYIERCARSLFGQTMTEGVEFIFVDDCTPDGSIEVLTRVMAEFPQCNVKILHHDVNKGLPTARKTGLAAASGEYILHVDSDDWIEPDMVKTLYEATKADDADIVVCDYYMSTKAADRPVVQNIRPEHYIKDMLMAKVTWAVWNKMVRRSLYDAVEFPVASMAEDAVIMFQLNAMTNKRTFVHRPLYHYFQNENSMSRILSDYDQLRCRCGHSQTNVEIMSSRLVAAGFPANSLDHIKMMVKVNLLPITASRRGYKYYRSVYPQFRVRLLFEPGLGLRAKLMHFLAPCSMYGFFAKVLRYGSHG